MKNGCAAQSNIIQPNNARRGVFGSGVIEMGWDTLTPSELSEINKSLDDISKITYHCLFQGERLLLKFLG